MIAQKALVPRDCASLTCIPKTPTAASLRALEGHPHQFTSFENRMLARGQGTRYLYVQPLSLRHALRQLLDNAELLSALGTETVRLVIERLPRLISYFDSLLVHTGQADETVPVPRERVSFLHRLFDFIDENYDDDFTMCADVEEFQDALATTLTLIRREP